MRNCLNVMYVSHNDKGMIEYIKLAFLRGSLLTTFLPDPRTQIGCPFVDINTTYDYKRPYKYRMITEDGKKILLETFETYYIPSCAFFKALVKYGFEVEAYFYESRERVICGKFTNEKGDEFFNTEDLPPEMIGKKF